MKVNKYIYRGGLNGRRTSLQTFQQIYVKYTTFLSITPENIIRSYNHQPIDLNNNKNETLLTILKEYRRLANIMVNRQLSHYFQHGCLSTKSKDFYGNIETFLSERYKDTIKRQIDGMLKSYFSNRKNDFNKMVYNSNLDENTKKSLYTINRQNGWFNKDNFLARKIFKQLIKRNRIPRTSRINLTLNTKVYKLQENKTTKSCSYHILLNTCSKNKEDKWLTLSLKTNGYFIKNINDVNKDNIKINNSIQLNFDRKNNLKNVTLSITYNKKENNYESKTEAIALDFGLVNLFTTNMGDILSKNFIKKLSYYDGRILKLQKELKRRNKDCKLKDNKRYVELNRKLREYIKNEVNRVINRLIKKYKPSKLVLENLEFRQQKLSKRLNRLMSNCGLGVIKNKLLSVMQDHGINIEYVNPCYTSQQCSNCNYIDSKNRKERDKFKCLYCNTHLHADVNGARNILGRSQDIYLQGNKYLSKEKIKLHITKKFKDNCYMYMDCSRSTAKIS